jgi:hypothetical protein
MGFFMSMARIGTRASVVGLGVLASLAFTAAPSWAERGNSANAKLCHEYPGALPAQDGSAFKNAGQCTSYGSEDGISLASTWSRAQWKNQPRDNAPLLRPSRDLGSNPPTQYSFPGTGPMKSSTSLS